MDLRRSKSAVSASDPPAGSVKPRTSLRPDSSPLGILSSHSLPLITM